MHTPSSLRNLRSILRIVCFITCGLAVTGWPSFSQAALVNLVDHGGGNQGPNYGLRVDNGAVQTFSFQQSGAMVTMSFDYAAGTGQISGMVHHNQSGQLWDIVADLDMHLLTIDGTEWRSNTSGDLYDGMIKDLIANGDNVNSAGANNLKDKSFAADRIGFEVLTMTMTLKPNQGLPVFTLDSQTNGIVTLFDFPQGPDMIPFMLAKGHRLGDDSDEITGFGWLDPTAPNEQTGSDGRIQDFLFRVDTMPEPSSLLIWCLAPVVFFSFRAARGRRGKV